MDNWKRRLEIIVDAIKTSITSYNNEVGDKIIVRARLTTVTKRLGDEIHQFIDRMSEEEIQNYTKLQLEAELLLSEPTATSLATHSKLPKLELPKFSGEVLKWSEFWDRFQASVDSSSISKADKLAYLIASLQSEALEAVQGLDITIENYAVATDILKERYGKPGIVIDAHYEAIHTMKQATNSQECMSTYNEIEKHLRILKSLGEDTNHNNLRKIIINKYPEDLIYEIRSRVKIEEQNVDSLRQLLEQYCSARLTTNQVGTSSFSTQTLNSSSCSQRTLTLNKSNKRKLPMPSEQRPKRRRGLVCIFCEGDHYNDSCRKLRTVHERKSKLRGKCFLCFKSNHLAQNCKVTKKCFYCKGKHNRALCEARKGIQKGKFTPTNAANSSSTALKGNTLLQTGIAQIRDKRGSLHKCRFLLDTGSQRSYMTKDFFRIIKPDIVDNDNLMVYTFGQERIKYQKSPRVEIEIVTTSDSIIVISVNVVPFITNEVPCFDYRKSAYSLGKQLSDDGSMGGKIHILIGNDYYYQFIKEHSIQLEENLYLVDTKLGWVCSGKIPTKEHILSVGTYVHSCIRDNLGFLTPDLPIKESDISQLWELDSIGIKDCPKATHEEEALRHFNENVKFEGQRYYIKWPWVQFPPQIPTNYGVALGRLKSLLKRLDSNTLNLYGNTIQEQESLGIIEKVDDFLCKKSHPVHYLPHHCVIKKESTTSLRLVYDASSKASADVLSLNECLYKGPLMLEDLIGLLLKFRQYETGITADIEKAFLQIGLHLEDRDVTRFLWPKDIMQEVSENNLQCYRFCRVPFGIITSPFLLNATIKHHLLKSGDNDLRHIADNVYVDNFVLGVNTTIKANILFTKIYKYLKDISMNVRQWNSNNKRFLEDIPKELCENKETTKVLGLVWNTKKDTLEIKINLHIYQEENITKRKVLKEIAAIYDPCGLFSPLVLPAKTFLQKLWRLKLKWDTKMTADLQDEWQKARASLKEIQNVKIDRYVLISQIKSKFELHCFTDASKDAYAAAVYIKSEHQQLIKVKLLMSKTKVTPLKDQENLQIPRLELLGTLIGCRLLTYVRKNMEVSIAKQYLWTDSQVVIKWLQSDKLLPPFVSRRVKEIKNEKNTQVLYISSTQNPADIATRVDNLTPEKREMWFNGPEFLKLQSEYSGNWALTQNFCISEGLLGSEHDPQADENNVKEIKEKKKGTTTEKCKELEMQNVSETIYTKIKKEQEVNYPQECVGKITDLTRSLGVFKDENGLLRCRGRVALADLPFDKKYPILLPKDSIITEEIISKIHRDNYHIGTNHTLSLVRENYWIPQGRSKIQKILRKCFECKKYSGGPYRLPHMPDLPAERVNYSSPFTFTGLDYLGPILVSNDKGETEKRWICLYTCLAVRAIHLEVIIDLSAEECTLALRRFIAQRGIPQLIISDNATQFKLSAEVLTGPYCIENEIKWKFIPELAPWHGGFYERLVGLVKRCLKRTIDIRRLKDNQLYTIIKEIELVLNTRPLSYVDSEADHTLKPIDFLRLGACLTTPSEIPYLCLNDTSTKQLLIEGWKKGQRMLEEFKKMFINQYLMALKERKDFKHKQPRIINKNSPKIGDVVQIKGDTDNRDLWKVGRIVTLHKSKDNEIRVATVKIGNKEYTRSIAHLFPIEVEENIESKEPNQKENYEQDHKENQQRDTTDIPTSGETHSGRPGRDAAHRAKERISKWTKELIQAIFDHTV